MRINQPVTQRERLYPDHQSLISTTDLESRITYANDEFCEIAGFQLDELVGNTTIWCAILTCRNRPLPICGTISAKAKAGWGR